MKKQAFAPTLCIALLAATGFISTSALASDGTITIDGKLSSVTCSVHGDTTTSGDIAVHLPELPASKLSAASNVAIGSTGYQINVGTGNTTDCPAGTKAAVHYEANGAKMNPATGNLINTSALGGALDAKNVEVQIADSDGTPINLWTNSTSIPVTVGATNTAILPFTAGYVSPAGGATSGAVDASVEYTVDFN